LQSLPHGEILDPDAEVASDKFAPNQKAGHAQ
jgi:hypothetical protein